MRLSKATSARGPSNLSLILTLFFFNFSCGPFTVGQTQQGLLFFPLPTHNFNLCRCVQGLNKAGSRRIIVIVYKVQLQL